MPHGVVVKTFGEGADIAMVYRIGFDDKQSCMLCVCVIVLGVQICTDTIIYIYIYIYSTIIRISTDIHTNDTSTLSHHDM